MVNSWRKYAQETYRIEKRYLPLIYKALKKAVSSFTSDLITHGIAHATEQLPLLNADLLPLIEKLYKEAGLKGAKRQYYDLKRTEAKYTGLGRDEQWMRAVMRYLQLHLLNKSVIPITQKTKDDLLKIFNKGITEGWGIEQIAKAMMEEGYLRARARTIARTEVVRASNVGHQIGAASFPYEVMKKWNAANDHRTRHSHRAVDGKVTDEHGHFEVDVYRGKTKIGTEKMLFPGDPNASAGNTINCRCTQTYRAKRDKNGRIIMRSLPPQISGEPRRESPLSNVFEEAIEELFENAVSELLDL